MTRRITALSLSALATLQACSVLSKEPPVEVRWFVPPVSAAEPVPTVDTVQLRTLQSARPLREEMVWWKSDVELAFDARHRWAEDPTETVARALRIGFADRGLAISTQPGIPSVQISLSRFGGVFAGSGAARAEVGLTVTLESPGFVRSRFLTVTVELADDRPETLATGVGEALDQVAGQVAESVVSWCEQNRTSGS